MPASPVGRAFHPWASDTGKSNWLTAHFSIFFASLTNPTHLVRPSLCLLLWLLAAISLACPTQAANLHGGSLGERQLRGDANKVTVTVLDLINPSAPILISPTDNSYVTTQKPTFVWQGSTDNNPMSHYQLWIDGKLYINLISLVTYENTEYKLVYDKTTRQYSLTLKKNLVDGTHTWKIIAYDQSLNSTSSATWSFTVDSLAPNFVINKVGRFPVTISAYDFTTIPTSPIELIENEPLLTGIGEPNSIITLTLTIPGSEGRTYHAVIDKDGYWSIQIGLLPRGQIVDLSFVIEDQAGLVTILNGVQLIIQPLFGAGSTLTPTPAQDGSAPRSTYVFGDYWPFADWRPIFSRKMAPIKEFVYSIITRSFPYLPQPLAAALARIPTQITGVAAPFLAWQNVIIFFSLPIAAAATVGLRFGAALSLQTLAQVLNALNIWPATASLMPPKKGGWIFDSKTGQGIAFAKLSLYSLELDKQVDEVVSDFRGYFPAFAYLAKKMPTQTYQHYRIKIEKNSQVLEFATINPHWPTKTFDSYTYFHNLYQGGLVSHTHQKPAPFWLIPSHDTQTTVGNNLTKVVSYLNGLPFWVLGWETVICFLILIFYTSIPNAMVVLYYLALAGSRFIRKILPNNLSIRLVDDKKQPIVGVKVFCRPIFDPTTLWVRQTDQKGFARFALTHPSLLHNNRKDQDYVLRTYDPLQRQLTARGCTTESVKVTVGQSPSAEQFQLSTNPTAVTACEL